MFSIIKPTKITATILWLSIFVGLFFVLFYPGRGLGTLRVREPQISSLALALVGLAPVILGIVGRIVLPKTKSGDQYQCILVLLLVLCEGVTFLAFFTFPAGYPTETAIAFIGSVLGVAALCPLTMGRFPEASN